MFLFPAPPIVVPDPVITETTVYYDIKGDTARKLAASLNEKGNASTDGSYWGTVRFSWSWGYETRMVNGQCELVNPTISATITRVYPRWITSIAPPRALAAQWNAMQAALTHYENQHVDLIRSAANQVAILMRANGTAKRCSALEVDLYNAGARAFRIAGELRNELDTRSHHGSTEGVKLVW
jgi:predicted secreted Zn-dependent protease